MPIVQGVALLDGQMQLARAVAVLMGSVGKGDFDGNPALVRVK